MIYINMDKPERCSKCRFLDVNHFCAATPKRYLRMECKDINIIQSFCPLHRKEIEGEWIEVGFDNPNAWDCSECNATVGRKCKYCPGCGARMKNGTRAHETIFIGEREHD